MKIENFKRVFFLVLAVVVCVTMTNTFYTKAVENEVVTDGLVAWYDAENNTAAGHDADSLVWEDLAGENDVTVTKNENSYFTADTFTTQNEEFNFPQEVLDTVNGEEFTVELEVGKIDILGTSFASYITNIAPWIAFILLSSIGANMIKESLGKEEEETSESFDAKTMFLMAVATSIDALAVGITFACVPVKLIAASALINTLIAVVIIGVVTFALSCIGVKIGNVFGSKYKSKAEFAGGAILILLGLKILLEHFGII